MVNFHRWTAPESKAYSDIKAILDKSSSFSLFVRKERREPFRHTCIELRFDDKPQFVISRRIPDKTSFATIVFGAPAVTYIEKVSARSSVNCGKIYESRDKKESELIIKKLLQDQETRYTLCDKNCRDHVTKTVLNAMEGQRWNYASKQEFLDFVENVRVEDRIRVFFIILSSLVLISKLSYYLFILTLIFATVFFFCNENFKTITMLLVKSTFQSVSDIFLSKHCSSFPDCKIIAAIQLFA